MAAAHVARISSVLRAKKCLQWVRKRALPKSQHVAPRVAETASVLSRSLHQMLHWRSDLFRTQ
jgi:hypothetical protein